MNYPQTNLPLQTPVIRGKTTLIAKYVKLIIEEM